MEDINGQGGEWDWGACCEIPKESIKNYVVKKRKKYKTTTTKTPHELRRKSCRGGTREEKGGICYLHVKGQTIHL